MLFKQQEVVGRATTNGTATEVVGQATANGTATEVVGQATNNGITALMPQLVA
jgi:hypothetical protein